MYLRIYALLRIDGPMGQSEYDRCREAPISKRASRLHKRKIRPTIRIVHSRIQLLHNLRLPHQLQPELPQYLR